MAYGPMGLVQTGSSFGGSKSSWQDGWWTTVKATVAEDGSFTKVKGNKTIISGPRLKNLNVAFSAYGEPIPVSMGVRRLGGTIIWAGPLTERMKKKKTGGESTNTASLDLPGLSAGFNSDGGGEVTVTKTYYYFADFAVSLGYSDPGDEDVEMVRMWANGVLVYDRGGINRKQSVFATIPKKVFKGYSTKFYNGTQEDADPLIKSIENPKAIAEYGLDPGTNVVPAYKGQMYVVLRNFPLAPFGNALPNIQIEVAGVSDRDNIVESFDNFPGGTYGSQHGVGVNWDAGIQYELLIDQVSSGTDYMATIDIQTDEVISKVPINSQFRHIVYSPWTGKCYVLRPFEFPEGQLLGADGLPANAYVFSSNLPNGDWWVIGSTTLVPWELSPTTATATPGLQTYIKPMYQLQIPYEPANVPLGENSSNVGRAVACPVKMDDGSYNDYIIWTTQESGTRIWNHFNLMVKRTAGDINNCLCAGAVGTQNNPNWYWSEDGTDQLIKVTGALSKFINFPGGTTHISGLTYSYTRDCLYAYHESATNRFISRIDGRTDEFIWTTDCGTGGWPAFWGESTGHDNIFDVDDERIWLPGSAGVYVIDAETGEYIEFKSISGVASTDWASFRYGTIYRLGLARHIDVPEVERKSLGYFIRFAGRQADLEDEQLSISSTLNEIEIDGAYMAEPGLTFRGLLENLRLAFDFTVTERDGVIYCKKRAQDDPPDDFSFDDDDYLLAGSGNSSFMIVREPDESIPAALTWRFLDFLRNYQENVVFVQRLSASQESKTQVDISIPIIMRLSEAKEWAYKALYNLWAARNGYAFKLPPAFMDYEPGDAGVVESSGNQYPVRLTRVTYNPDFSMDVVAQSYMTDFPTVIEAEDPHTNPEDEGIVPISAIQLFVFDMPDPFPLLNDNTDATTKDTAELRLFAGPELASRRYVGGQIFKNSNYLTDVGANYIGWFGSVPEALPTTDCPFALHENLEITVLMAKDDLVFPAAGYASLEAFLNDENGQMLLIGKEIIRYKDVTDNMDGTYTLGCILRGLRGTDIYVNTHTDGEGAFLLAPSLNYVVGMSVGEIGSTIQFKSNTAGNQFNARTTSIVAQGVSQKPFAPSGLRAVEDSGIVTITWEPRTRAPGQVVIQEDTIQLTVQSNLPQWDDLKFKLLISDPDIDRSGSGIEGATLQPHEYFDDATTGEGSGNYYECTLDSARLTEIFGSADVPEYLDIRICQVDSKWGDGLVRGETIGVRRN